MAPLQRRRRERELRDEIAAHLDEATQELVDRGVAPRDARRAALVSFGGVAQTEDAYRDGASFRWLERIGSDVRLAFRTLRRTPGFALVVLTTLAIGIGSLTAVFALLDAIVIAPLPYPKADQLVVITHSAPGVNQPEVGLSSGLYFHYAEHAASLESLGQYDTRVLNLRTGDGTEQVRVTSAGESVFRLLQVTPELGRLFTVDDGRPGFMNLSWQIPILLSHACWITRFGSDPHIVGRVVRINDSPREVVGVLPERFAFPDASTDIWMLSEVPRGTANFAGSFRLKAIARLRMGVTPAAAQADLARVLPQIAGAYRDATPQRIADVRLTPIVTPLKTAMVRRVSTVLWTLLGGMTLLLIIAVASAASLFTIRAASRRREVAVRQALGAGRRQIAQLFAIEALTITATAAAAGLGLTRLFLRSVVALAPVELPRATEVRVTPAAFAFAFGVAIAIATLYGAIALRQQRGELADGLSAGERVAGAARRGWLRDPFLTLQVAVALTLMIGSALMVVTYRNLSRTPLGFSPQRMLTVDLALPGRKAGTYVQIYQAVVERARTLPGVETATIASFLPLTAAPDLYPVEAGSTPIPFKFVTPGFFGVMGTTVVEGADVGADGNVTGARPVLVSAVLAHRLYPHESALGKPVQRLNEDGTPVDMGRGGPEPPFTIAGVVADVAETTLRGGAAQAVYVPIVTPTVEPSIVPTNVTLAIRTTGDPLAVASSVRSAIATVDPSLSVGKIRTMDAIVLAARGQEAFVGVLLLFAAATSLLLGVVSVYGSVAHVVRSRTREIGIRIALGAATREIVRVVARSTSAAVGAGLTLGVVLSLAAAGLLRALLFGVAPRDPMLLLATTTLLAVASLAAALLAARRALSIVPIDAIRRE
jgi:predicted permease